jgi:hypothetical protein
MSIFSQVGRLARCRGHSIFIWATRQPVVSPSYSLYALLLPVWSVVSMGDTHRHAWVTLNELVRDVKCTRSKRHQIFAQVLPRCGHHSVATMRTPFSSCWIRLKMLMMTMMMMMMMWMWMQGKNFRVMMWMQASKKPD